MEESDLRIVFDTTALPELAGVFSFTLYTKLDLAEFNQTSYYRGVLEYLRVVHRVPYFSRAGVVIYTDPKSAEILRQAFPSQEYPKLIFAVCNWPMFEIDGIIEPSVMRCLRFHAVKAFPDAWVAVRDADTIFKFNYDGGFFGNGDEDKSPIVARWEQNFLEAVRPTGKTIIAGVEHGYATMWHRNFPTKRAFRSGVQQYNAKYIEPMRTDTLAFLSNHGIFAGFMTFLEGRPGGLWDLCEAYLTSRYDITDISGKPVITNEYFYNDIRSFYDRRGHWSKEIQSVQKIGKDERILLFAILPTHIESFYFFYIPYTTSLYSSRSYMVSDVMEDIIPIYNRDAPRIAMTFKFRATQKGVHETYYEEFKKMIALYQPWLQTYNSQFNNYVGNFMKTAKVNGRLATSRNNVFVGGVTRRQQRRSRRLRRRGTRRM